METPMDRNPEPANGRPTPPKDRNPEKPSGSSGELPGELPPAGRTRIPPSPTRTRHPAPAR